MRQGLMQRSVMVICGIVVLILAILIPSIGSVRVRSLRTQCLSIARSNLTGTLSYATDFKGYPPALFQPRAGTYLLHPPEVVAFSEYSVKGYWFYSTFMYHHLLRPTMPAITIYVPKTTDDRKGSMPLWESGQFYLSETLYAAPSLCKVGVHDARQLRIQRLEDVRYPDRKGLLQQQVAYFERRGVGQDGTPLLLWTSSSIPGAVAWGHLSATTVVHANLEQGIANPFDHDVLINGGSFPGYPVLRTKNGILGIDRPSTSR